MEEMGTVTIFPPRTVLRRGLWRKMETVPGEGYGRRIPDAACVRLG